MEFDDGAKPLGLESVACVKQVPLEAIGGRQDCLALAAARESEFSGQRRDKQEDPKQQEEQGVSFSQEPARTCVKRVRHGLQSVARSTRT